MIRTSIVGVSGYTGLELLRLALAHPQIKLAHLTSRQNVGEQIGALYPHLAHLDHAITNPDYDTLITDSDVVFLCLPHKTAQEALASLHGKVKVIDLSADYRLDDVKVYEKYYTDHAYPQLLKEVIYGAPEFHRDAIKKASSVANPGCFALLSQLMLYPFAGQIESADIMAVTGSSGSGKSASDGTHHPIRSHNMKSYNINAHRHIPEITRTAKITEDQLNFVPTSGPFVRGIFATAFITLSSSSSRAKSRDLESIDNNKIPPLPTVGRDDVYGDCPFIRVTDSVALANIVGSNFCDLSYVKNGNTIVAQGALDNLVKGAAGCAIQNMNLMCGLNETEGLITLGALYP